MLTSFPPLLSEVREKSGEVWEEGAAGDCAGFVGVGNFSFSSPRWLALPLFVHSTMLSLFTLLLFASFLSLSDSTMSGHTYPFFLCKGDYLVCFFLNVFP